MTRFLSFSLIIVLLGSLLNLCPTLFWFQEVNINLSSYYLLFQIFFILIILYRIFKYRNKIILNLITLIFLTFLIINNLLPLRQYYIADYEKKFPSYEKKQIKDQPKLSFYYANLLFNNRSSKFIEQIKLLDPDFVLLLEVGDYHYNLIKDQLNYSFIEEAKDLTVKMLILSKYPKDIFLLKNFSETKIDAEFIFQEYKIADQSINLLLWHAKQPLIPKNFSVNKVLCRRLASMSRDLKKPLIVFGDFNATPYSNCFKWFNSSPKLFNAMTEQGFLRTWNARSPFLRLTLDHIFYNSFFRIKEIKRLDGIDSDHYPFFVKAVVEIP